MGVAVVACRYVKRDLATAYSYVPCAMIGVFEFQFARDTAVIQLCGIWLARNEGGRCLAKEVGERMGFSHITIGTPIA